MATLKKGNLSDDLGKKKKKGEEASVSKKETLTSSASTAQQRGGASEIRSALSSLSSTGRREVAQRVQEQLGRETRSYARDYTELTKSYAQRGRDGGKKTESGTRRYEELASSLRSRHDKYREVLDELGGDMDEEFRQNLEMMLRSSSEGLASMSRGRESAVFHPGSDSAEIKQLPLRPGDRGKIETLPYRIGDKDSSEDLRELSGGEEPDYFRLAVNEYINKNRGGEKDKEQSGSELRPADIQPEQEEQGSTWKDKALDYLDAIDTGMTKGMWEGGVTNLLNAGASRLGFRANSKETDTPFGIAGVRDQIQGAKDLYERLGSIWGDYTPGDGNLLQNIGESGSTIYSQAKENFGTPALVRQVELDRDFQDKLGQIWDNYEAGDGSLGQNMKDTFFAGFHHANRSIEEGLGKSNFTLMFGNGTGPVKDALGKNEDRLVWALKQFALPALTGSTDKEENAKWLTGKAYEIGDKLTEAVSPYIKNAEGEEYLGQEDYQNAMSDKDAGVQLAGNVAAVVGNMIPSIGISVMTGSPEAAKMAMSASAAGAAAKEAYDAGATPEQAYYIGVEKGTIEYLTECMFDVAGFFGGGTVPKGVGKLLNAFADTTAGRIVSAIAGSKAGKAVGKVIEGLGENVEEAASDWASPGVEKAVLGQTINGEDDISFLKAMEGQLPWSEQGFITTLSTVVLSLFGVGANAIGRNVTLVTPEEAQEIVDYARETGDGKLISLAEQYQKKIDKQKSKGKKGSISVSQFEKIGKKALDAEIRKAMTDPEGYQRELESRGEISVVEPDSAEESAVSQEEISEETAAPVEETETVTPAADQQTETAQAEAVQTEEQPAKKGRSAEARAATEKAGYDQARSLVESQTPERQSYLRDKRSVYSEFLDGLEKGDRIYQDGKQTPAAEVVSKSADGMSIVFYDADGEVSSMERILPDSFTGDGMVSLLETSESVAVRGSDKTVSTAARKAAAPAQKAAETQKKSSATSSAESVTDERVQLASAVRGRSDAGLIMRGYHAGQNVETFTEAWSFAADVLGAHTDMTVAQARENYPHKFREMTDAQLDLAMTAGRKAAEARARQAKTKAEAQKENRAKAAETKQKADTSKGKKGSVSMKGGKFNGRTYRGVDVDSLSKKEKRVVAMAQRLADAMGYHFVFFEGHPADGGTYIGDGTIFVNIKAGNLSKKTLAATVIGHEVVHSFQEKAPTAYEALQKHVLTHILQKSPAEFEALVQAQMKLEPGISYGKAVDELVANACQTMVRDSAEIRRLVRENMTLAERVRDTIEGIADKFKSAYADVDIHDNEEVYRAARAIEDAYDEILEDFDSAVREYKQNADAEKVTGKKISAPMDGVQNMVLDGKLNENTSEQERYNLLKDAWIVLSTVNRDSLEGVKLEEYNTRKKSSVEAGIKHLAQKLGILNSPLKNSKIDFEFSFSGRSLSKSLHHQLEYGGSYQDYVKAMSCFNDLVKNAVPIEVHKDKKAGTKKADPHLERVYVLVGAFKDGDYAVPVEFEVKERKDQDNGLYLTVTLTKIDLEVLETGIVENEYPNLVSKSIFSIRSLFENVNPKDGKFLKYAPDGFLDDERIASKKVALEKEGEEYKEYGEEAVPDYGENPDAPNMRFGTEETAAEKKAREDSVKNLEAENRILRARAEYWKGQTQQTRERTVRQQDTDRLANDLLRRFESRADRESVKKKLRELGDWLVQSDGDTLSYDELYDRARAIAEDIVDGNYALIDDSQKENLERLKDYLKSTPVKLTAEDWSDTGDENFRRRYGRYFTVSENGRTIDSLWGELAATFGEGVFPEDTYAPGDMLNMLGDYLDMWKPQYGNVFEANWNEAVDAAAGEIIDRMLGEGVRQTPATFADRAQQRLNAQIAKDKAKLDALREQKNARIEEIKRQASEKSAQIRMSEKAAKYEAVSKVKEHYQDMMQRQSEKRTETAGQRKYRAQVAEKVERLEKMLLTNSDKMHVPEVLKAPLADFLASIDFSSKSHLKNGTTTRADVKFQAALTALNDVLTKQERYLNGEENAEDRLGGYLDISQEAMDFLRETTEEIHHMMQTGEAYTVNAMSAEQLQGLSKLLSNITSAIRNMNNFMANERFATVKEAADADIRHMESLGSASEAARGSVVSALAWENGTPFYVLRRFGEGGKAVFDAFARGWEKMAFNVKEIIDFTEKVYTDKEVKTWKREIHDITLSDGSQIRMTTAQIMALSQLIGREQAVKHITKGGIRIGNIKGKVGEIVDTNHYHLTPEDMSLIIGQLTPRQMSVAKALQRFMAVKGAQWGNEVSMRRFGYNFYDEGESYYPIRTDSNDRGMQDTEAMQNSMFRLLNLSASKSINPKASNALLVEDIFDTFADHMADMAKLNGMGLPVLDAIKWFNYKDRVDLGNGEYDTRTIQGAMEQAFGDRAQRYFRTLMKDINGVTEAGDRGTGLLATLMSNYKAAAVGANLRVAFLQPTSYVRAAAIISPKYLAFAFTNRNAYKEALANSGTAVWKSLGYYDTNISRGMREQIEHNDSWKDKIVEGSMSLAELGDKLTWGRLWVACKMQAKATNQSLEGRALIDATSDLFREVIYATQVMDSTLTRSELMRGKTLYSKAMTAFMAEPTLSYNLLMDAVSSYHLDVRANGKQGAWRRNSAKIGTAFSTYVASAAFAAVVESVADAFRDDDNDEFWEKFLEALLGEGVTARIRGEKSTESILASLMSGNLAQDLTIIGKLPYVKSMYSTLQGYKSKDMSSAAFDAIIDSVKIWQETVRLANGKLDSPTKVTYYGNMTDWGKIYKSLQAISQLSGIGGSNLTRDVLALWNTTVGEFRPDWKIKTYQSKAERTYLEKVYPHDVSWSVYQSALSAMDTDENGSVKQDEAGPYLRNEMESGRLTEEQAEAIWSAATSGKKTLADWIAKNS